MVNRILKHLNILFYLRVDIILEKKNKKPNDKDVFGRLYSTAKELLNISSVVKEILVYPFTFLGLYYLLQLCYQSDSGSLLLCPETWHHRVLPVRVAERWPRQAGQLKISMAFFGWSKSYALKSCQKGSVIRIRTYKDFCIASSSAFRRYMPDMYVRSSHNNKKKLSLRPVLTFSTKNPTYGRH